MSFEINLRDHGMVTETNKKSYGKVKNLEEVLDDFVNNSLLSFNIGLKGI